MKRLSLLSALALALTVATVASAEPASWRIDRAHTEVGFDIRHFFNKVHGRFTDFDGTIVYDPANLAASSVEVTIRDSSVNTGTERRDNHLRTEDFFWVEKHPTITFKSTKVLPGKDPSHFQVVGDLTMRGIAKPVTLDVEFLGSAPISMGGPGSMLQAGFYATTRINRKDWGFAWNKQVDQGGVSAMMLADDVDLTLNVAAMSEGPKGAAAAPKK